MNLRQWRESEGLTQAAAAKKCNLPVRTWEGWEVGKSVPRADAALVIIKTSGGKVTLEDLVKSAVAR